MLDLSKIPLNEYGHVQTRDGRPVRILCVDAEGNGPFVGLLKQPAVFGETISVWFAGGKGPNNYLDLIPVPKKRKLTGFMNAYEGDTTIGFSYHKSREIADSYGACARIACLDLSRFNIEFTEGEGLE